MVTFLVGLIILFFGYVFYSKYVEKQFEPDDRETPAVKMNDGVDFLILPKWKNLLIHLLNIAGLGPILGVIQGVLFGPIAFILIPLGCIFMGGVHDYFAGMLSVRNDGAQITDLIKKYLGGNFYKIFLAIISLMLLLVATVFVYTSGDIISQRFFGQTDFSLNNPVLLTIYLVITAYFLIAAMFPIDKIIGKFYPIFTTLLILGSLFILVGFFTKGVHLQELTFGALNIHPKGLHILPMFFMTISCGLLSGFHCTQATIISRTIKTEYDGKQVFYGMMCAESLIAMIWAAAAMYVYDLKFVPDNLIGTANVINFITDIFVSPIFAIIVILAVVILPITTGDTALRALRITLAEVFKIKQNTILSRLKFVIPITFVLLGILFWAKMNSDSFSLIWRYFNFVNQLIAIPTFLIATIFLYEKKKNFYMTLLPGLFFIFITSSFIFNVRIGFNLPYWLSEVLGVIVAIISLLFLIKKLHKIRPFV